MRYELSISDPQEDFDQVIAEIIRFTTAYGTCSAEIISRDSVPDREGLVIAGGYGTLERIFTSEVIHGLSKLSGLEEYRNALTWTAIIYSEEE